MKRYDVQIRIRGEWQWMGVAPTGHTLRTARHIKAREALQSYWRDQIKVEKFRVREVSAEALAR